MRTYKRRNYLVQKKFQIKCAVMVIALLLIYTIILLAAIFGPAIHILSSERVSLAERAEAAETMILLNSSIWPWISLVVLLFAGISIFITHRLAGPVFAIKRTIQAFSSGDLTTRVHLRKRDELRDLGDDVNHMADWHESLLSSLDERFQNIATVVREIARQNAAVKKSMMPAEVEAVEHLLEKCKFKKKGKAEAP